MKLTDYLMALLTAVVLCNIASPELGGHAMGAIENRGAVRAPELIGGTGWLNTDRPIYIKEVAEQPGVAHSGIVHRV